ncbi:bifunctional metallophosphatase/5'-nucleotidase [Rubrivivax rivuli]|uniref:Bifunctional metallophosphatase/5'-nucleotidase n=1 Tax=Rubrivivax rivuli TaxID=1862385 RepID=A0A437RRB7_9BURK|nr:5'-nucleotidase C-terminal domain-containing protein [Rubrivivax rivuli]RVU49221.1 bifunctional metallophosphatase/5'-nucleotidase [Rubrivivax rivuli]
MRLLTLLAAAAAAALAGCATAPGPASAPVTLRVIAFNDLHGNLESSNLVLPHPDPAKPGQALRMAVGGAAHQAGLIKALRAGAQHSVVVSSGDAIGATPLVSALFWHESTIDVMNRMGVDIATLGNHEFDAGVAELQRMVNGGCRAPKAGDPAVSCALGEYEGAKFPFVSANIVQDNGRPLVATSVIREVGGIKVGFIGAVTTDMPSLVVPSGIAGLRFIDESKAINAEAARLQAAGVQALVAVIHEGGNTGEPGSTMEWNDAGCANRRGAIFEIEKQLSPAVDVVLSGHSHQGYNCKINGRPVMQATAQGRGLSVLDLVLDPTTGDVDRARSLHRNLPVFNEKTTAAHRELVISQEPAPYAFALSAAQPDAAIAARVAAYSERARPLAERKVGRIAGNFATGANNGDMAAGRLVADAQWHSTRSAERGGSQFALMNNGGVRAALVCRGTPPCDVSFGDVFTMQPFGNTLVVMTLSGAEIQALIEGQSRAGALIPSSNIRWTWRANAPQGQRVQNLRIGGEPVNPAKDYRLTVNSFMAEGGDGFTTLRAGRNRVGGDVDIDALMAFLAANTNGVTPDPDLRYTVE